MTSFETALKKISPNKVNKNEFEHIINLIQEAITDEELRSCLTADDTLVVRAKDWAGDGLLSIASWHGKLETVRMLLNDFNADVNARNSNKTTALHRASACGDIKCATLLMEKGADLELRDGAGRKPLDVGSTNAMRELIKERSRTDKELLLQLQLTIERANQEFDTNQFYQNAEQKKLKIANRLNQAVPIIFKGALNADVNGIFDPIYEILNEWPVYSKRNSKEGVVCYYEPSENSWVMHSALAGQGSSSPERGGNRILKMSCGIPNFPELRLEGSNGIKEFGESFSSRVAKINVPCGDDQDVFEPQLIQKDITGKKEISVIPGKRKSSLAGQSYEISVIPESEWLAEQEMLKLKLESGRLESIKLHNND
mmetsp:Transcript_34605/g.32971  ORF Transcript_34605/g.32971 Transcript_34605/m.32971 type:complete len:371 (-) Transcript_34605:460-1572(-)|eukprot:CAMPEP_0119051332 /NCGR_PEP_ID=MMETSP1177-20130426/72984_1 /TAXON_ID=2985 /ORGANISM="Ochromonas sp, Strain CCMP1899" /LENGTH=370 /DNA_ID=CAMNT_0007030501 /DNA_START=83 /DNA_END=1195 /DNA_ORIENTATION=+